MPKIQFTTHTKAQILASVRQGNYLKVAAASSGVGYRTVLSWLQKGKEEASGEYFDFYTELKKAEAEFEQQALSSIVASDNPKYLLEVLSRKNPTDWAATSRVSIQVKEKIENFLDYLSERLCDDPIVLSKVLQIASDYQEESEI